MIIFSILAVMEMSDWTAMMARFGKLSTEAATYGITTTLARIHLLILIALSIGIILAALITVVGYLKDGPWTILASKFTGVGYFLYGGFQIYSYIFILTKGKNGMLLAGIVYMIIGLAVFDMGKALVNQPLPTSQSSSVKVNKK